MQDEFAMLIKRFLLIFAKGENLPLVMINDAPPDKHTGTHLLVDILPLTPEATDISMCGKRHEWTVTTQVRIRDDEGESLAKKIVDRLVAYCSPHGCELQQFCGDCGTYRFIRIPDPRPALTTDGWYSIPVDNRLELLT